MGQAEQIATPFPPQQYVPAGRHGPIGLFYDNLLGRHERSPYFAFLPPVSDPFVLPGLVRAFYAFHPSGNVYAASNVSDFVQDLPTRFSRRVCIISSLTSDWYRELPLDQKDQPSLFILNAERFRSDLQDIRFDRKRIYQFYIVVGLNKRQVRTMQNSLPNAVLVINNSKVRTNTAVFTHRHAAASRFLHQAVVQSQELDPRPPAAVRLARWANILRSRQEVEKHLIPELVNIVTSYAAPRPVSRVARKASYVDPVTRPIRHLAQDLAVLAVSELQRLSAAPDNVTTIAELEPRDAEPSLPVTVAEPPATPPETEP